MISRRNIRIKVMQALFAYDYGHEFNDKSQQSEQGDKVEIARIKSILNKSFSQSENLFLLTLTYLCRTAQYVRIDAEQKAGKYLQSEEDKNINQKMADNMIVSALWENPAFQKARAQMHIDHYINTNIIKRIYKQLIETPSYKAYLDNEKRDKDEDKKILKFLWEDVMLNNEDFLHDLDEDWANWEDDQDMIVILVDKYFEQKNSVRFRNFLSKEKKEYAENLLTTVIDKKEPLIALIQKRLKNWEANRIAKVDLILLKMGVSEFLYFPTIPVKVTINEYIDIAKDYSTDESGQFINGVLDNLRKDLNKENKLRKIDIS